MYNASEKFTAHTGSSTVRRPKSKIEAGGVTYTGETALVTYPKISHSTEKLIGGFPTKTVEFEIFNRSGDISLNGQEIAVYRGLEIEGETEWIPMGLFSAKDENITNEATKRTIRFKGSDRSQLFDTQFTNDITYPCTVLEFVEHLCERHGVELETADFPFSQRVLLSAPNADSSISERECIARIAELGGCIAQISRLGGLRISAPQSTDKTVNKSYYKMLSKEPEFGEITAVTLGHQNYTDDIVYPEGTSDSAVNWKIEDNPFVDGAIAAADGTTPTTRQTIIADIAANILDRSVIPFSVTDFVDDFIFDLGDIVTVEDKDGGTFETVILNISTSSRIRSAIGAATQSSGSTNFALAGSVKQQIQQVKLEVDHQNNKITALAQDFSDLEDQTEASLTIMSNRIQGVVTDVGDIQSSITQLSDSVDFRFNNLADPDSLINAATSITPEGVKVYNGKIEIYNSDNEKVFGIGTDGNLQIVGTLKTGTVSGLYAEVTYGGLNFYMNGDCVESFGLVTFEDPYSKETRTVSTIQKKDLLLNSGGIITRQSPICTNYGGSTAFAGLCHYRTVSDSLYKLNVGIGSASDQGTAALELHKGTNGYVAARLDIKEGTFAEDAVEIRGMNSYNGGVYSSWLTLGKTNLKWNGATVSVSSSAEKKSNISSAGAMLDKIRNAGIYTYNYKTDVESNSEGNSGHLTLNGGELETEDASTHYGLVIGDGYSTPEEVISSDGAHIDLYSMVALAWKAIQELADKFEEVTGNADEGTA